MKSYTMLMDEEILNKINEIAGKEDRSTAYIIRHAIDNYLASYNILPDVTQKELKEYDKKEKKGKKS